MVDPSLCREVVGCGAFPRCGSARFQTSALALLCVLSALPAFAEPARRESITNETSRRLAITSALTEASNRFRLPVHWLRAVMRTESGGDANSVSSKGAIGLMQLMPATYAELRTRYGLGDDAFDPHANILAGAAYLRELLDQYGERGFLAAYNAGPGRYEDYLRGRSLPAETTDYVERIAPALSLGRNSAAPYAASSDNCSSPIFVALTRPQGHDHQRLRHSADGALRAEGSTRRSLIPAQPDVRLFAVDLQPTSGPNASFDCCSFARLRPLRRSRAFRSFPMTQLSHFRRIAHVLAPLCASAAEGAPATELVQDKRDSLRLCPAVGLSLRFNAFTQAAFFMRSLSVTASASKVSSISTSSALRHVG